MAGGLDWAGGGVLGQPPGQVHDLEVGPQLTGQRRVIGQQLVGVGRPAGLDAGQVGVQDAHDLGVVLRPGGAGPRAEMSGGGSRLSLHACLSATIARPQSLRTALGERPMRAAISSTGTCSRLRRMKTSR